MIFFAGVFLRHQAIIRYPAFFFCTLLFFIRKLYFMTFVAASSGAVIQPVFQTLSVQIDIRFQ